jgi:CHAT domain-containing protein
MGQASFYSRPFSGFAPLLQVPPASGGNQNMAQVPLGGGGNQNRDQPLPAGWSRAQFEWLSALGNATRSETRAQLLRQHREWQTPPFVRERYPTLNTEVPAIAKEWLSAAKGLVVLSDSLRQPSLQGFTRLQLAYLYMILERPDLAHQQIRAATPFFKRARDTLGQARALHLKAMLLDEGGEHRRALDTLHEARRLYRQLNTPAYLARCEYQIAVVYHQMGDSARGLTYLQQAMRWAQAAGDQVQMAHFQLFAGVLYRALERYEEALQSYHQALPMLREAGDTLNAARVLANIGLVHWSMGLLGEARRYYEQAMPLFHQMESRRDVAFCLMNTGLLLQEEGDLPLAAQTFSEARQLFEQLGDAEGVAFCHLNLASVFNAQRQSEQALMQAREATQRFQSLGFQRKLALAQINQAIALLNLKRFREADVVLSQVMERLPRDGDRVSRMHCLFLRGECARGLRQLRQARAWYEASLRLLQQLSLQNEVPLEERSRYLARFREMVSAIADFYVGLGDAPSAFRVCQQGKGSVLRQMLPAPRGGQRPRAAHRLENYAGLPLLDAHTALVEYAVAPDSVAIILLRHEGGKPRLRSARVPLRQELLHQTVGLLRRAVESGSEVAEIQRLASRLYGWLLAPLEPYLKGVRRLVLCPDGILHALPWSVLYQRSKGYLIQQFALTVAPSATLWAGAHRQAATRPHAQTRPLLIALSRFGGSNAGVRVALRNLPGVATERKVLQRLFGNALRVLGEGEATRSRVLTQLPRASLIHFATHAVTNARIPLLSGLALAPQGANRWLSGYDVLSVRLRARLTVLSACSTAEGMLSGDGQVGLAWAFLGAGCPTVLATLWQLPDEAVPLWMEAFYRAYRAAQPAAEASRQATLALLNHPRFAHPRYWCAWCLIGSGE